jgi:hypothetical protein
MPFFCLSKRKAKEKDTRRKPVIRQLRRLKIRNSPALKFKCGFKQSNFFTPARCLIIPPVFERVIIKICVIKNQSRFLNLITKTQELHCQRAILKSFIPSHAFGLAGLPRRGEGVVNHLYIFPSQIVRRDACQAVSMGVRRKRALLSFTFCYILSGTMPAQGGLTYYKG